MTTRSSVSAEHAASTVVRGPPLPDRPSKELRRDFERRWTERGVRDHRIRGALQDDSTGVNAFGGDEQLTDLDVDVGRGVVQQQSKPLHGLGRERRRLPTRREHGIDHDQRGWIAFASKPAESVTVMHLDPVGRLETGRDRPTAAVFKQGRHHRMPLAGDDTSGRGRRRGDRGIRPEPPRQIHDHAGRLAEPLHDPAERMPRFKPTNQRRFDLAPHPAARTFPGEPKLEHPIRHLEHHAGRGGGLDRQVQLAIGLEIGLGIGLGIGHEIGSAGDEGQGGPWPGRHRIRPDFPGTIRGRPINPHIHVADRRIVDAGLRRFVVSETPATAFAPVFGNVLEMIGNTPMLELKRLDTGPCRLFVKMESMNPGNSIKDRIAVYMIDQAEKSGRLKPGGRIVEATAGNTGLALALIASQKGYDLTVVVPDKMSDEKISHLRAMGADVHLTRSDVAKGHPEYYQEVAASLAAADPNSFYINQFSNDANPQAHYETTGPEIWGQMDGDIDAFVSGVGSGGTVSGVGRYLKERNPAVQMVLADPEGSILAPKVNDGLEVQPGAWLVEGIGEDFVPDILDLSLVDSAIAISDEEAFHTARELLRVEGVLAGSSVGTLLAASLRYCREQTEPKRVVSLICDNGAKYLSKMFNDHWMMDQGFIKRERHNDLRDLIGRRHLEKEDYCLTPELPLHLAIKRMHMYDVSQMVILDSSEKPLGILDESDVLLAMVHDDTNADLPVSDFMTRRLEIVDPAVSMNDLVPIFRADRVAIVADTDHYYGLITRMDMINFLRTRVG